MNKMRKILLSAALTLVLFSVAGRIRADSMVMVPEAPPSAESFMVARNWLWAEAQLLSLAVPSLFVFTGFGARISALCSRLAGGRYYRGLMLFAMAYLSLDALIVLPFDFYRGYASLGDMADPLLQWAMGEAVSYGEKVIGAIFFIWIPYALIVRNVKCWWFYTAASLMPVAAMALVVLPVWIRPLTASYHPLQNKELYSEIQGLAGRCGIRDIPVLEGGNDTTVVGLGPTSRILLGENLLAHQTPEQIRFTVGHELKHYVMGDEVKGLAIIVGILFLGFFLIDRAGTALIARYEQRIGFHQLSDPASLPLFILIFTMLWLCILPFFNWYARHIEFEADRFGLELTHENRAMAEAEAAYITQGGDSPEWDTFFRLFRATHPSDAERIRFANSYRPWAEGKPGVYGNICH